MIDLLQATSYGGYGAYGGYGGYGGMWSVWLTTILQQLLYQAPVLGVWALGLLLSIVALRRTPVALACVIGAVALTLVSVGLDFSWLFVQFGASRGWNYDRMQSVTHAAAFAARLVEAGAWALLLIAIPAGRIQRPEPDSGPEQPAAV